MSERQLFLMEMYRALWDNINRHILVVWESVAVMLAGCGALFLSKENIISYEASTVLMLAASAWLIAHSVDASGWFNRNLHIIANIEREFLTATDGQDIHFYFERHRGNSPIAHLGIQMILGTFLAAFALFQHFIREVWDKPQFVARFVYGQALVPYLIALSFALVLWAFVRHTQSAYDTLVQRSPGKERHVVEQSPTTPLASASDHEEPTPPSSPQSPIT